MSKSAMRQSSTHVAGFLRDGYLVLRGVLNARETDAVTRQVREALAPLVGPVEYEVDVGYPGAPSDRADAGGNTPRRLLAAYARGGALQALPGHPRVAGTLRELFAAAQPDGTPRVCLSQAHHNCIMTKHPGFSSATLWHQDIRYWSFDRPELISAWFALGHEHRGNGALRVLPGTHLLELDRGRLDRDLFLRPELADNRALIHDARVVELQPGDVLLFHCRLFHAAGRNNTAETKLSPVFTYHTADNRPIPGTRSASLPGLPLES